MRLRSYPSGVKFALAGYALAFAFGTLVHVTILLHFGPPPHAFVNHPLLHRRLVYGYDTLAFLDPLVIFLLLRFPRAGLLLALAIMLADVGVNTLVDYMDFHPLLGTPDPGAQANSVFLGFVLGSAPLLWPYLGRKEQWKGPIAAGGAPS
jgi:hypothetical protein